MASWLNNFLGIFGPGDSNRDQEPLPHFRYHPNPLHTGMIAQSNSVCPCCKKARGFVYTGSIYSEDEVEDLCPWCIASGEAAKKYDGVFSDDGSQTFEGIPQEIVDEVCLRTPGYNGLQQEMWLTCCGDACEFHGYGSPEDIKGLDEESLERFKEENGVEDVLLEAIYEYDSERDDFGFYKFICRKCGKVRMGFDLT